MALVAGDRIGPYRIGRPLGSGGMGEVYETWDAEGNARALKVFAADHGAVAFLQRRFLTEGRLLAKLSHPRLVHVYDVGVDEATDLPYFVMGLVLDASGSPMTLEDFRKSGEVPEEQAERWYGDLCAALDYCHAKGVVHRDVKLNNVLLDAAGHAVLSDFGISRVFDPEVRNELQVTTTYVEGETTGTRPVMGTYWYLAPEMRKGAPATTASDWYALGVTFFRLLTGLWYEPGTDALELLAPLDRRWRDRLERLLSEDPAVRVCQRVEKRRPRRFRKGFGLSLLGVAFICAVALAGHRMVRLTGAAIAERPPRCGETPHLRRGGVLAAPVDRGLSTSSRANETVQVARLVLTIEATNRFDFCLCPSGTNAYRNIAVAVTRPYWLAATPVTRRQWFAVRGEPLTAWEGGADAPMTYVTRDEVTNFCARLNVRFSAKLPRGYEIRLPTLAEWRLAYAQGKTVPTHFADKKAMRRAYVERGWYGQGINGEGKSADMRRYYADLNRPLPLVTNIWPTFPPHVINPSKDNWTRYSSEIPPVPVGLKPANEIGLHDMLGNCYERVFDTCSDKVHYWGKTEWGATTIGLYAGQGLALTNPVERTRDLPLMVGTYLAPDIPGDRAWSADFDRMPHLGFRLCIGPLIPNPNP